MLNRFSPVLSAAALHLREQRGVDHLPRVLRHRSVVRLGDSDAPFLVSAGEGPLFPFLFFPPFFLFPSARPSFILF